MSLLIKIPCILVAMVGLQIAVTPPHPPPSSDERAPSTRLEVIVKQRTGPFLVKSICWAAAAAEAAVILATHAPSLTLSQTVLSTLVRGRGSDRIQLSPLFVFGTLLTGLGGYIRYRCYRALGRLFTFEMSIRNDHKLITDGPYGIVRHPGYTGILFTITGIICWHASSGSWARECGALETTIGQVAAGIYLGMVSVITTGLMSRMSKEDAALRETFPKEWDQWAAKVPYKLIPWVY